MRTGASRRPATSLCRPARAYADRREPAPGNEPMRTGASLRGPARAYADRREPAPGNEPMRTGASLRGPARVYADRREPAPGNEPMQTGASLCRPARAYADRREPAPGNEPMRTGASLRGPARAGTRVLFAAGSAASRTLNLALMLCRSLPLLALAAAALLPRTLAAAPPAGLTSDASAVPSAPRLAVPLPCPGSALCPAPGEPPSANAQGLRTVYLNFDGVTLKSSASSEDSRTNLSFIISSTVAEGQSLVVPSFEPGGNFVRSQVIATVVDNLKDLFLPYNVVFTTTRPPSGDYHMVVFGSDCAAVAGKDCAGIALLDCGDSLANNIVFVFPGGLRLGDLATTAAQELAHALGLAHTTDRTDVMYPSLQEQFPVAFGAGPIPDEACFGETFQDSHQAMLDAVGFPGQDTTKPSVRITSPASGATVEAETAISATISDDTSVVSASLLVNGAEVATRSAPPYDFTLPPDTAAGKTTIVVRASDSSENVGEHRVIVTLAGEAQPCDEGTCPEGLRCEEDLCVADADPLGTLCESDSDCASALCAAGDDEQRCSESCSAEAPCPAGFACRDSSVCWPADEVDSAGSEEGGCAIGGDPRSALGALGLAFIALLAGTRRRRPSRARR